MTTNQHRPATHPPTASPPTAAPTARPPKPVVPPVHFDAVPWKRIGVFVGISYAILAVFALPFWFLPGGITHPLFTPLIGVGMFAPLLASVILAKGVEKTSWRTRVGLRLRGRGRALLTWVPLALVLTLVANVISTLVTIARGVPADLTGMTYLSTFADQVATATGVEMSILAAAGITLLNIAVGLVITTVVTFGEEVGWRGWLWPALRPLGPVRAAVVGGVIWALWHLPIVLLGYNYPGEPRALAVVFMVIPCIGMTLLFGAFTERAGGNPIPAAVGHAAINSTTSMLFALISVPATAGAVNYFLDTPLGAVAAAVMFLVGLLIIRGRAGVRDTATPEPATMG